VRVRTKVGVTGDIGDEGFDRSGDLDPSFGSSESGFGRTTGRPSSDGNIEFFRRVVVCRSNEGLNERYSDE
jgi:hypothetical protein